MFSSIQDQQSTELSQHHVERRAKRLKITQQELKLPEVIALHACQVRPCMSTGGSGSCLPARSAGTLAVTAASLAVLQPLPSWQWLMLLAACLPGVMAQHTCQACRHMDTAAAAPGTCRLVSVGTTLRH